MIMIKQVAALAAAALCAIASAQTTAPAAGEAIAPAAPPSVTGNFSLVSDYRFRGISQSWGQPAVQGGIDYTHASGFYLGNWNSSVSSNSYNNGSSLEVDLYGGYRFEPAKGWTVDIGVLNYQYPGARLNSAPATPTGEKYDNTELYVGITQGPFNAKLSYAVTDYFGLNSSTSGYAYWSALPARGDSKGTSYLDLNYTADLGPALTLGLHVGYTSVRNYSELSYADYKISLAKELGGLNLGLAVVATTASSTFYQAGNSAALDPQKIGKTAAVLSISKTF
ncbi:MAG: TorF family putative porin [Pseudomonadota bacterium]